MKKKKLLYSTLLLLIFSGNNFVVAKDVTVSTGTELQSIIQKTTEPTKIQFDDNIYITGLNTIKIGTEASYYLEESRFCTMRLLRI